MSGIKRIEGCNFDRSNNEVLLFTNKEMIHARFDKKTDELTVVDTSSISAPKIYSRIDNRGRLLTVDKASNNLTVTDLVNGKVVKKYPGNQEEPYSKNLEIGRFNMFRIRRVQTFEIQ
jgi:hypothetical protein